MKSEKDRRRCARKIKDAIEKHKSGKLKTEKLAKIIDECGIDPEFWTLQEQQNLTKFMSKSKIMIGPQYEKGDNTNRSTGFLHSPYFTVKGKFFQNTIKPMIRKAIHMSEWWIINKYDKDAFVYDDLRLKRLDDFLNVYIEKHFRHVEYKIDFMHQIRHIVIFIAKEDPYYTNVFFDFINKFVVEFKDGIELTEKERTTFEIWHVGNSQEIRDKQKEYNEQRNKSIA